MSIVSLLQREPLRHFFLCVLGLCMLAGVSSLWVFPVLDLPFVRSYITLQLVLFACYALACWLSKDLERGWFLWLMCALGVGMAALVVPLAPTMSDDMFRYVWDGQMQGWGVNPFFFPPSSEQLWPWADLANHPFINHPDYRTIYPPTAQWFFWLGGRLTPGSPLGYKCLLLLCHVMTAGVLGVWCRRRGLPLGRVLWFLWCPLPLFEVMLDGHVDGLAPVFVVSTVLLVQSRRPWLAGGMLALALLAKPLPLLLLPVFLWHLRWRDAFRLLLACGIVGVCLYLPYADAGALLFQSMRAYARHWSFNGPLYTLLNIWLLPWACRLILAICLFVFSVAWAFMPGPLERKAMFPLCGYVFLAPTLYPWYLVWLVPWLVMVPRLWLFWVVGTVCTSHYVQYVFANSGSWVLPMPVMLFEFVPVVWLLLLQWAWTRKRKAESL